MPGMEEKKTERHISKICAVSSNTPSNGGVLNSNFFFARAFLHIIALAICFYGILWAVKKFRAPEGMFSTQALLVYIVFSLGWIGMLYVLIHYIDTPIEREASE